MELPGEAARALEAVRRTGRDLRFEIKKACEQERWRLKVLYRAPDPGAGEDRDVQLGLVWSDDLPALEALRNRLEGGRT
jgi:hypothetical protein